MTMSPSIGLRGGVGSLRDETLSVIENFFKSHLRRWQIIYSVSVQRRIQKFLLSNNRPEMANSVIALWFCRFLGIPLRLS